MHRSFADFSVGLRLESAERSVSVEEIKQFARQFDPQPFHLEEVAAAKSLFSGLAASGWHTAAMTMQLFVTTMAVPGGIIGLAVDELRWPMAVRPGDRLKVEIEILESRRSRSKKGQGILRLKITTLNQRAAVVQEFYATALVPIEA